MVHNTNGLVPMLKQCRIIYNNISIEFKTSRYEELLDYVKEHGIASYVPNRYKEENVIYLDCLIIFSNRAEFNKHKKQLKEFEENEKRK